MPLIGGVPKKSGWIDISTNPLPLTAQERVDSTNAASKAQVYEEPVKGGRETTAGKKLEWKVAFPVLQKGELRGVIPFWCEDVTPRGWRVESFTSSIIPSALTYNFIKVEPRDKPHPNGGVGIASFTLLSKSPTYIQRLSAILVAAPSSSSHQFELGTPAPLSATRVKVFVREPDTEAEKQWVEERGEGLWEVDVLSEKGNADELGDGNGARIRFRAA